MQSTNYVLKNHFCCERKAYFMRLLTNAKGTTPCNTSGGRVPQEKDQHGPRTDSPRAGQSSQGQNLETRVWLDSSAPQSLSLNTLHRLWFVSSGCFPRAESSPSVSVTRLLAQSPQQLSWLERGTDRCLRPVPASPCLVWQTLSLSSSLCSPCRQK